MFFKTKDSIPEGYGFSTFGLSHLIWLAVLVIACVAAALIYKRLSQKNGNIMRKSIGIAIVVIEIIKDIIVAAVGEFGVAYLPLHLCGINILLIGFDVFKPTKVVRGFLYYFCIPGALMALLFPNWTTLPAWNFFYINSFIIHILLVVYPIMLISNNEVELDFKYIPRCICLLVAMAIPIYFINLLSGENFMFLMEPDKGNPLELFEKLLGNHLWGFLILLPAVMLAMYIPIMIIKKVKTKGRKTVVLK